MGVPPQPRPCYLVEWYQPELSAQSLSAAQLRGFAAAPVQLLLTLALPADEIMFGVFAAPSAQTVARTCRDTGIPARRITAAVASGQLSGPRRRNEEEADVGT